LRPQAEAIFSAWLRQIGDDAKAATVDIATF
jgi:hypothetical protein